MHQATFVADLAVVLAVAGVTAVLARTLRQPTILGYLFAGLIVGPYIPIPIFADPARVEALAEFGVILVMFAIGLEFQIGKLLRVLPVSGATGIVQVSFLMWCGFSVGQLVGWNTVESVFLGASIAISSTMIVSKVFEQRPVSPEVRQHVLGVLVVQDVLAIVLIAAMTGLAAGEGLAPERLAAKLGGLVAVLVGLLIGGMLTVPRIIRAVTKLGSPEIVAVVSIGLCFALAELAHRLGYSVALGAFLAGILVAESGKGHQVETLMQPVRDLFAAVFFVSIGMTVEPHQAVEHASLALIVFAVVVVGQFVSVSIVGVLSGHGVRSSVTSGLALGQIGEFAFIIAAIGISAGVVRPGLQSVLVTVAVLTAFTTPIALGGASRVVDAIDRKMPARLQHLLSLHAAWLERSRASSGGARRNPLRRAVRALAFDAVGLVAVAVVVLVTQKEAAGWLQRRVGFSYENARSALAVTVLLVSVPLLAALMRNVVSVSRLVSRRVFRDGPEVSASSKTGARALRLMVQLVVVLGVGLPAVAILRPFTSAPYGAAVLTLIVAAISIRLWRSTGAIEDEFRSGAEQIAVALGNRTGRSEAMTLVDSTLIPGLDSVFGITLPAGAHAVGQTLAEVNLRARTGATVVAIHRGETDVLMPTGHETLRAGDMLAIAGTEECLSNARSLLVEGPVPVATDFLQD